MEKAKILTDEKIRDLILELSPSMRIWLTGDNPVMGDYKLLLQVQAREHYDHYSKIIREIFDYKCEECSTPGFVHLVIPVKEVKKYLED